MTLTENDTEALAGLPMFWEDTDVYKRFVKTFPIESPQFAELYERTRQAVESSLEYATLDAINILYGMGVGTIGYTVALFVPNVADVFRATQTNEIVEPTTTDEWVKAIANEYRNNDEAGRRALGM